MKGWSVGEVFTLNIVTIIVASDPVNIMSALTMPILALIVI